LGAVIYSIFFESLLIGNVNNKDEILKMVAPIGFVLIISSGPKNTQSNNAMPNDFIAFDYAVIVLKITAS
jgi:hypothetical protein